MLLTPLEKTAQIEDENMAVMSMFDLHGMQGTLPYEVSFLKLNMQNQNLNMQNLAKNEQKTSQTAHK